MIGTTISHYHITEKLGRGGMGEVYRAEDLNLSRHVAIKVLPDEFTHDAERLARFQREAQVLASLSHPNIATLYGLEESDGIRFIIMELVEGQTLAHRLLRAPLPLDEAVEVCRQIAEGLGTAHEKGVIHRDLKPGNVMLTADDKVKVLDFGLAKALAGDLPAADATHSPTITEAMTGPGVILGTAAYMSPEQARGKPVDKRADIWSFGCVLYECLTGRRAFQGDTITETVASILKSEPDWTLLPAETPPFVRAVLWQCLQKDPARRLHDIADAQIEMGEPVSQLSEAVAPFKKLSGRLLLTGIAMALIAGALTGAGLMWHFRPVSSLEVLRAVIKLEPGQLIEYFNSERPTCSRRVAPFLNTKAAELFPEFSPDGRWMAYSSDELGQWGVYVRPFPGLGGKWQVSSAGGGQPLWARNGKQLFYREGEQAWVADVRTDAGFAVAKPRLLFEKSGFLQGEPIRGWDLSPDGQRFLMVKEEERKPQPVTELILVQNWFEELKRLCPTGK